MSGSPSPLRGGDRGSIPRALISPLKRAITMVQCSTEGCTTEIDESNIEQPIEEVEDNILCNSCAEGKAFSEVEPPEEGWSKGSDMDRI